MTKYNIIHHITTKCNYNCSYCDVVKDNKILDKWEINEVINFIKNNYKFINRFKFFWWEPLLSFENIKNIIDETKNLLGNKFEIVTNTSLLTNEVWEYFEKYFEIIFFSIDSENDFNYEKVLNFIKKYNLQKKVYFNIIVSPWFEKISFEQFKKLYSYWIRQYNILPVYYTKSWSSNDLKIFSSLFKEIIDLSLQDKTLKLYWFVENKWENFCLLNESLFIDIDLNLYYTDFVSTYYWKEIKKDLHIWNINEISLANIMDFSNFITKISKVEQKIYSLVNWQRQLHKIMDYFSKYLNEKWIIKD
jgi:MoaA/NifB/PqqE/SkfB family radical SAM enzyme